MNLYFTLASYAVASASGFAVAWQLQAGTISDIHLEAAHELMQQQADARDEAERRIAQVTAAQDRAQVRAAGLAVVVADNRSELERLRDTTDSAMRAASENIEACTAHAATQGGLLNHCATRLIDVSEQADRHVSDIKTLMQAWPGD